MGFRTYILALQPDQEITLNTPVCNFFGCTAGEIDFTVSTGESGDPVVLRKGISLSLDEKFNSLRVKNGASAQTVELYIGSGDMRDARLIAEGGTTLKANRLAAITKVSVGAAAVMLNASNVLRSSVLIVNTGLNTLYWGLDNAVTSATGLPLVAGASISITAQSAIWAIQDTAPTEARIFEEWN